MTSLVEFLEARIAEDEVQSQRHVEYAVEVYAAWNSSETDQMLSSRDEYDPHRRLAECAAKRRLIDLAFFFAATIDGEWGCCHDDDEIRAGNVPDDCYGPREAARVLAVLAAPYASDPSFDPSWVVETP